jgi:phosphoribosylformylglycinamidine synthase
MNAVVIMFPGSNREHDVCLAWKLATGHEPARIWHRDATLPDSDLIILPGGFAYGDYLRCGAMAAHSPIMREVKARALRGTPVLGICNGFQILCEAHLLRGALTRNQHLHFRNRDQRLAITSVDSAWTNSFTEGQEIVIPVKNGEGCYVADQHTLDELDAEGLIVARYLGENPNGSQRNIAAIRNPEGNVVGIMPHPEHAIDTLTGPSLDGLGFFGSLLQHLAHQPSPSAFAGAGAGAPGRVTGGPGQGVMRVDLT